MSLIASAVIPALYPGKGILKGLRIGRLYEDDFQSSEVHVYKYKLLSAIDIL